MKSKNKVISMILAFVFALGCAPLCSAQGEAVPELSEYGFVDCGDVKIEYGVCGKLDLCSFFLPTAEVCTALTATFCPKWQSILRL